MASSLTCVPWPHRWENKDIYAAAIRSLRLRELQNDECVMAVRAGLGSIIPLQLLTTLSPLEMELRTCGLPYINLEFLKVSGLRPGQQAVSAVACPRMSCVPALSSRVGGAGLAPISQLSKLKLRESHLPNVTQPASGSQTSYPDRLLPEPMP